MEKRIVFKDMPVKVKSLTKEDSEGFKTVILNSRLSYEENLKSYLHECSHDNDFGQNFLVNELEDVRHKI